MADETFLTPLHNARADLDVAMAELSYLARAFMATGNQHIYEKLLSIRDTICDAKEKIGRGEDAALSSYLKSTEDGSRNMLNAALAAVAGGANG